MGRRWAERVTGPKAAHWTRPTWPRREKSSKPPWTSGYGPVHAVGLHGGPTGRVTLVAQRPFTQPQPGKGVLPLPKAHAAPGGGAAYPLSSVAAAPWARAGVRFGPTGQALSPARIAHGPKACCPGKAVTRVTRRGAPARWAPPVARPWPWRAWVRPASSRGRKHLQQNALGTKAGSQQNEARHRGGSPRDATRRG
jgi:hypothetical protein